MRFIFLLLGIFCSTALISKAQVFREVEQSTNKSNNLMAPGEVLILNSLKGDLSVNCSFNKTTWNEKLLKAQSNYMLTIPREKAYLYVEICQESSAGKSCDVYRISGKMRYVIRLDEDENKLTIVKAYE